MFKENGLVPTNALVLKLVLTGSSQFPSGWQSEVIPSGLVRQTVIPSHLPDHAVPVREPLA